MKPLKLKNIFIASATFLFIWVHSGCMKSTLALHFIIHAKIFVYLNYEERQQGITRMNVVACGNKKYNKRWMDVKWIEQGSSEWTQRCNKWQTTELKIDAGSTFSSAQVKHETGEKNKVEKKERSWLAQVASHQLEGKTSARTHTLRWKPLRHSEQNY